MKNKFKILGVFIALFIVFFISMYFYNSYNVRKSMEIENEKINHDKSLFSEEKAKKEEFYAEELVKSYSGIFARVSNDKEIDYSYLNSIMDKESDFYKKTVNDIEKLRNEGTKLNILEFNIEDIKFENEYFYVSVEEKKEFQYKNGDKTIKVYKKIYIIKILDNTAVIIDCKVHQ